MHKSIAVAWSATIAALYCLAAPLHAQAGNGPAGYIALAFTPTGGLAPAVRPWMAGLSQRSPGFGLRWGHLSLFDDDDNIFVGGVTLPFSDGRGDVAISAGYLTVQCDGCHGEFVAGATAEQGLLRRDLGGPRTQFGMGLSGSLGFGKPNSGTVWSVLVGAPVYISTGNPGKAQIVPFVTPSIGWGLLADRYSAEGGVRFVLGSGIGIVNIAPGLGVHLGIQKTFIQGGKTVFGAGLTYGGM